MRRRYVDTVSGATFEGEGYAGVIRDMRNAAWLLVPKRSYMREVSERIADLTSRRRGGPDRIRWQSGAEAFIEDLVTAGFLTKGESNA